MIITIDGPVATGKSTIARKLAEALGYIYFDTGAMYRALTYAIVKSQVDINDPEALQKFLDTCDFDLRIHRVGRRYVVNGEDVTEYIRSRDVTSHVSQISAIAAVRDKLVAVQRQSAQGVNAVFEGRDMGTTVFPDADLKIFLTGRIEVRAQRRLLEIQQERPKEAEGLTLEQVVEETTERDRLDSTREVSPLKKAKDAFVVDTSDLNVEEVVFQIFECKDQSKAKKKT